MPPLTLRKLVTRRNTLRLIPIVIALSLLGVWFWHDRDYIRGLAENSQPVTLAQLSAMGTDAGGRWFEIKLDAPPRHLLRTTEPTLDRRGQQIGEVITDYYALAGDFASATDRAIILVHSRTAPPATVVAQVVGEDTLVYAKVRSAVHKWKGFQFQQGPLSPVLLITPGLNGMRVMWAVVSAMTIGVALMLWLTLRGLFNPLHAGPVARLRKSVRAPEGLLALTAEIDRELAGLDPKARRTGLILLPSWLVHKTPFSFSLIGASDVIWAVPRIALMPGIFRKSWMRDQLIIMSRDGSWRGVTVPENQIPDRLTAIHRWAPWAVIGVNETMKAGFGLARGTRMRRLEKKAAIIAVIDKRREEILAQRAAQPGPPG